MRHGAKVRGVGHVQLCGLRGDLPELLLHRLAHAHSVHDDAYRVGVCGAGWGGGDGETRGAPQASVKTAFQPSTSHLTPGQCVPRKPTFLLGPCGPHRDVILGAAVGEDQTHARHVEGAGPCALRLGEAVLHHVTQRQPRHGAALHVFHGQDRLLDFGRGAVAAQRELGAHAARELHQPHARALGGHVQEVHDLVHEALHQLEILRAHALGAIDEQNQVDVAFPAPCKVRRASTGGPILCWQLPSTHLVIHIYYITGTMCEVLPVPGTILDNNGNNNKLIKLYDNNKFIKIIYIEKHMLLIYKQSQQ